MFLDNAMERINRLILQGGRNGMTELQFYAAEIREWKNSLKRMDQIKGADYYEGRHDILNRKRTIIGADGKLQEVDNLPNNRLIDNQYALMVDQKTNYLVGKPFTVNCQNKAYADALNNVFNKRFHRLLKYVCEDALNGGLGWLFPFYDKKGNLAFKHFPAYEVLPFWADDDHTILDSAIRLYPQEVWDGYTKKIIERVELFKTDGLYRYIYDGSELKPDVEAGEHESYFTIEEEGKEPTELNWERIPLIPFKYNKQEIPLIRRVKTLQDGINTMISDFENNMRDDVGKKFQVVLFRKLADYEGVVSVKNGLTSDKTSTALIPWVTGVIGGTAVNKSATNMTYDGEYDVDTDFTQTQLENGIREGSFMFHRVDEAVCVLTDINSFISITDEKSSDFSSNQTIRVLDQIANDIAVLFGKKYLGKVPNDAAGRISLWNDIVKHHTELQDIRAIENFSGENVTVEKGDTKKSVVVTDYVTPVNAMEQLYMTVYVQ